MENECEKQPANLRTKETPIPTVGIWKGRFCRRRERGWKEGVSGESRRRKNGSGKVIKISQTFETHKRNTKRRPTEWLSILNQAGCLETREKKKRSGKEERPLLGEKRETPKIKPSPGGRGKREGKGKKTNERRKNLGRTFLEKLTTSRKRN